jgi:hypothetical protein
MKLLLIGLSCRSLGAGEPVDPPSWTAQAGIIRGDGNPYTDSERGPLVGLAWTLPLTPRQGLRAWSDFTTIQGERQAGLLVPGGTGSIFLWDMVLGQGTGKQDVLTLGLDYRIAFLTSRTTPYFFVGAIGGRIHWTQTFLGGGYHLRSSGTTFKGGGSLGFGMRFANRVELELRTRGFNGLSGAGFYSLALGYRF